MCVSCQNKLFLNAIQRLSSPSGRCIPRTLQCSGEDDCGDMSDEVGCKKASKPCREEAEEYWGIENLAKGWVTFLLVFSVSPTYFGGLVNMCLSSNQTAHVSASTYWTVTWKEWCSITDTTRAAACRTTSRTSDSGSLITCNSTL